MAIPSEKPTSPLYISLERIQKDVHKLRKLTLTFNPTQIWEVAGDVWDAAHTISSMAKDSKVQASIRSIRKALSEIILETRQSHRSNPNVYLFEEWINKISDACAMIAERI